MNNRHRVSELARHTFQAKIENEILRCSSLNDSVWKKMVNLGKRANKFKHIRNQTILGRVKIKDD